jgi:hypothetical protein
LYRAVKLTTGPLEIGPTLGVKRERYQPEEPLAAKGTVFHERFTGSQAVAFLDDGQLQLQVSCREDAGGEIGLTKYAVAVTIEAETEVAVYEQIRQRLRVAPRP